MDGDEEEAMLLMMAQMEEKTVCSIKTGVNDFLDYIGIFITFIMPMVLGKQDKQKSLKVIEKFSFEPESPVR